MTHLVHVTHQCEIQILFFWRQNPTPIVTSLKQMGCQPNQRYISGGIRPSLIIEGGMPLGFPTDHHGGLCQALY